MEDLNLESTEMDALGTIVGDDPSILDPEPQEQAEPSTAEGVTEPAPPAEQVQDKQPETDPAKLLEIKENLNRALHQERERYRALKAEAEQQQQMLAQYQAQMQEAQARAKYEELVYEDPEQAAAFLQQQREAIQQQAQQQMSVQRAAMSVEMAKSVHSDFDQVVQAFLASPAGQAINLAHFDNHPAPALALYEFAKANAPVDRETLREQLKQELLAELAPRLQTKQSTSPKTIGNLPAAAPNEPEPVSTKAANRMNLAAPGSDDFHAAYKAALESADG